MPIRTTLPATILALASACGGDAAAPLPAGCSATIGRQVESEGATHVPDGTKVEYKNNPPSSGNHASTPLRYGKYRSEQAREAWVHALEHGGVVLLYNCPGGCDADRDRLEKLFDQTPPDETGRRRVVVAPDTRMPKKFAALAWTWILELDELEESQLSCFISAHKGHAPENL